MAFLLTAVQVPRKAFAQDQQQPYVFSKTTEMVFVDVAVRDNHGNFVHGLKASDFTVLEENHPQQVTTFDFERITTTPVSQPLPLLSVSRPSQRAVTPQPPVAVAQQEVARDHRLIVLFFDFSAMEPDDIDRAVSAAQAYVKSQMTPADLVAVVSLATDLNVDQDFTSDRDLINAALNHYSSSSGQGFENGLTGSTEGTPDTSQPFAADDTEYNIFNTDRKFEAIESLADRLSAIDLKKSILYFTNGINKTGLDNQSRLRAAINSAVRSNVAIYPVDVRGLQALPPGGEARQASLQGTSPYSGAAVANQFSSNFDSQETLVTLAGDTGGRAFLDTNDLSGAFKRVLADTSEYYVLGYHPSSTVRDGSFRRIRVRVNRSHLKLDYRAGYFAPRDYAHFTSDDREQQLQQALDAEYPFNDLRVYLGADYFRQPDGRFFISIALVVPGSQVKRKPGQGAAQVDVAGVVRDAFQRPIAQVRDTVKLNAQATAQMERKNVQYSTGVIVPSAGRYHLKFVVRDNQSGAVATFETDLTIPDFKREPVHLSSVVLASELQPAKKNPRNPLIYDGQAFVVNVSHVFSRNQHLYIYYEVYDPARQPKQNSVRVLSSVEFLHGSAKAYQSAQVDESSINDPERRATVFRLDVPLAQLRPGFYMCQVNVIDDVAARFMFPRLPVLIR